MKTSVFTLMLSALFLGFPACEKMGDPEDGNGEDGKGEDGTGIAQSDTRIQFGDTEYAFELTGEEIPDNVIFFNSSVIIKLVNSSGHTLQVDLAGPDIYDSSSSEFLAIPNLPFEAEENLASIQLYDPNEALLNNNAIKYCIDGIVSVDKLTTSEIELTYEGEGLLGGNSTDSAEGRLDVTLELMLTDFGYQDFRN